jgi:large conductance mechanosensitive channel
VIKPPNPLKLGLVQEFRDFLIKQNALALAVGVVIGGAVGKVVSGIVEDIFMPIIGLVLPGGEWRNSQLVLHGTNAIKYGDLIGRLIDFTIVAMVVFFVTRALLESGKKPEPAAPTKSCPQCLETIPAAATRCRACAQPV